MPEDKDELTDVHLELFKFAATNSYFYEIYIAISLLGPT